MLLDHQAAAFGLLGGDDGLVGALLPVLAGRDAVAFLAQGVGELAEPGSVILLSVANHQVELGLRGAGNQPSPLERQPVRLVGLQYYQDAADLLHGRLPVWHSTSL
ncbi:hypothetical protein D9M71_666480 [compost metagenome]